MRAASLVAAVVTLFLAAADSRAQGGHSHSYTGAPTLGDPQAPLVLVEFSDFHCPFCRQHAMQALPRIKQDYVDTGKVLYVFRHFPSSGRPGGIDAAVAAQCAARQGRFWELHDRLFSAPRPVQPRDLERLARGVGVDAGAWRTCVRAGLAREDVRLQIEDARRFGLGGTPAFLLGFNEAPRIRVGQRIGGAQSYEAFRAMFEALLRTALSSTADTGG